MSLLFLLGVIAMWIYVGWVIYRRGNIEPGDDIPPERRKTPREPSEREKRVFYRRRK